MADPATAPAEDAHDRMMQMVTGYWITQIVHAVAAHAIADHLAKGPATAAEIAVAAGTDADATFRLLRASASIGLVALAGDRRFAATPLLDTLRQDRPGSLRGMAMAQGSPGHWLPWGRLVEAVRTGKPQAVPALGAELFDHYAAHPAEAAIFTQAMTGITAQVAQEAARVIDTRGLHVAADIGGAGGALLHALLQANPVLRGIVFDRPNVVPEARAMAARHGLADRVAAVAGDFFAEVPPADLHLLKYILHDWDDDSCRRILANCRRALRPGGKVVIVELVLGALGEAGPIQSNLAPFMDLNMMVLVSGRERSLDEFRLLFQAAGLRFTRVIPAEGPMSFIEAEAD